MNERTIAAVALSNRDFDSYEQKLQEAARWTRLAAQQGAQLVVLPEMINRYCGDGPGNAKALDFRGSSLDDWQAQSRTLLDAARDAGVALAFAATVLEDEGIRNSMFLLSAGGQLLGRYDKICPTQMELDEGVVPGEARVIEWNGLRIGGAICFDTWFPTVFEQQVELGAQLFLVPSLWAGGDQLNHYARIYSTPIVLAYPAWSRIIGIDGHEIAVGGYRNETLRFGFGAPIVMATINFDRVALHGDFNQQKMVDVQEAYGDKVRIAFDQNNATFYLESRSPDLTVQDVVSRFDLIPLTRYFGDYTKRYLKPQPQPV